MHRLSALALFGLALVLRLVYLAEIRHLPWFDVPVVDGANYIGAARMIAAGDWLGGREAFWQPPLYPYFLALLIRLFGPGMTPIYVTQAILGALSCVLVYTIGRRLFDTRAALAAGLVMAAWGPLVHFDVQPLIPVLHIALALGGLVLLLRAAEAVGEGEGAATSLPFGEAIGSGLLWGLSAIATPNILFVAPAAAFWLLRRVRRPGRAGLTLAVVFLAGVSLPVLAVTARNLHVAGEALLISGNGGINFFIGNNADYERTVHIRPGGDFQRLAQMPENIGVIGAAARSRWFVRQAAGFLTGYPAAAVRLYLRKAGELVAGREIPRNESMYDYRGESRLLSLLLWRKGVAFPFGVIAPLAVAGAVLAWRDRRGRPGLTLLLWFAALYALSIVLFFPTDRYRLPVVPVLALFAGRLIAALLPDGDAPVAKLIRRPSILAALAAGFLIFNLDACTPTESWPEETALNRAYALRVKGRRDEARQSYQQAIDLNPGRVDPYNALAALAAEEGRWEDAVWRYRELLAVAPDFVEVRCSLGLALQALGRRDEARREWQTASYLAPAAGLALAHLSLSYLEEGLLQPAEEHARRAVEARPDLPEPHLALGLVARAQRRRDLALQELQEAAHRFQPGSEGRRRAEEILSVMQRRGAK